MRPRLRPHWPSSCLPPPWSSSGGSRERYETGSKLDFGQFGRGPGEALACDEAAPAEFYYIPAAPGHAEKSGNARVGPSARAIIAAYDGHEGRLALPWEMRKARPTPPIGAAPACPANSKPEVPGHTAAHCI